MIDLESVTLRGFLSWGETDTTVKLSGMGQCFIAGVIGDVEPSKKAKSSGAGKSSLLQSILWCLSGRTMYDRQSGKGVLNWFSAADAHVSLNFKDGAVLTRHMNRKGETELLYARDGRDIIHSTLSTTTAHQNLLAQELDFDFDVFCGSVFFSQFRQPWMLMSEQARKKLFEHLSGIDRVAVYSEVAKRKLDRVDIDIEKLQGRIAEADRLLSEFQRRLADAEQSSVTWEQNRRTRMQAKSNSIERIKTEVAQIELIDLESLKSQWDAVAQAESAITSQEELLRRLDAAISSKQLELKTLKTSTDAEKTAANSAFSKRQSDLNLGFNRDVRKNLNDTSTKKLPLNTKADALRAEIATSDGTLKQLTFDINQWQERAGTICSECHQTIDADHISQEIGPKQEARQAEIEAKRQLQDRLDQVLGELKTIGLDYAATESRLKTRLDAELAAAKSELAKALNDIEANSDAKKTQINQMLSQATERRSQLSARITSARSKISKPAVSMEVAKARVERKLTLLGDIARAEKDLEAIKAEPNPYQAVIADRKTEQEATQQKAVATKQLKSYQLIWPHLEYIRSAYSDRRKIKAYLVARFRPYYNGRLAHYLDVLGLDIKLQLTDSLGFSSNRWNYNYESGGERSRTDLACMFAGFDLREKIFGPQSNILVLDEPDKGLDDSDLQALISIIQTQLAPRFESIFIISHRNAFRDVFPHQITVQRLDRISRLLEAR